MSDLKFRPSALTRIGACPGSVRLISTLPEEEQAGKSSAAAETGTLRHAILQNRVESLMSPWQAAPADYSRPPSPDDEKAVDALWPWIENHPAMLKRGQPGHRVWSEVGLEIGKYCGLTEGMLGGTADLVLATPTRLGVFDAKFGARRVMPTVPQLKAYAVGAGALLVDRASGDFYPEFRGIREVELIIGQPMCAGIDSVVFPLTHLQLWAKEIGDMCRAALAPDPKFAAGDHCTFCPAALKCPARRAQAEQDVIGVFAAHKEAKAAEAAEAAPTPASTGEIAPLLAKVEEMTTLSAEGLTPEQYGKILDLAPVVEALFKDLRTEALKRIKAGEAIPGWALGDGKRSREWTVPTDEAPEALGKIGLKAGEIWVKSLATPAALETLVKGSGNKRRIGAFADLWRWKPGSPVLVPAGQAHDSTMFSKVTEEKVAAPTLPSEAPKEEKPKRRRRTKAEIEADNAAKSSTTEPKPFWL